MRLWSISRVWALHWYKSSSRIHFNLRIAACFLILSLKICWFFLLKQVAHFDFTFVYQFCHWFVFLYQVFLQTLSPGLFGSALAQDGSLILQDRASCLSAFVSYLNFSFELILMFFPDPCSSFEFPLYRCLLGPRFSKYFVPGLIMIGLYY